MTTPITRTDLRAVLESWQRTELTAAQVHDWAEERYAASAFEPEDDVANEVLAKLDMLDMNLTTVEDVPSFLAVLQSPPDEAERAITELYRYVESIDITAREHACAGDSLYAPFCRSNHREPPN
jgi:hypothetical protein